MRETITGIESLWRGGLSVPAWAWDDIQETCEI